MAERLHTPSPEQHESHKAPERREHAPARHHERHEAKSSHERVAEARQSIHEQSHENQARERLHAAEKAATPVDTPQQINRELQSTTRQHQFSRIRRRLSPAERTLSKVIHQPVVRVVSEAAGKTVSRPSGLLGGGLVAFLGTSAYLYLARHIGFEYNYGVFLVLFFGGFVFGVLLELIIHATTSSRRKLD